MSDTNCYLTAQGNVFPKSDDKAQIQLMNSNLISFFRAACSEYWFSKFGNSNSKPGLQTVHVSCNWNFSHGNT